MRQFRDIWRSCSNELIGLGIMLVGLTTLCFTLWVIFMGVHTSKWEQMILGAMLGLILYEGARRYIQFKP